MSVVSRPQEPFEPGMPGTPTEVPADEAFLDRELSWLEFNFRVLHEAQDDRTPLLDRLLFLGIFTSNLDEFFMKRVGSLRLKLSYGSAAGHDTRGITQKLAAIRRRVVELQADQDRCYRECIRPGLAEHGIHLLEWSDLSEAEREEATEYFRSNVFAALTPLVVDQSHPFPFVSNLSLSLAIALVSPGSGVRIFARVKVPEQIPQWIPVGEEGRYVGLDDVIQQHLPLLFPGLEIEEVMPFRVTRSAAVDEENIEADDLLELVEEELRQRRLQQVVRLEHSARPSPWLLEQVVRHLHLEPDQVYELPGELDYTRFKRIVSLPEPSLRYRRWAPTTPPEFSSDKQDIFAQIREGDLLVHHPYESFDSSVARFIRTAVDDPHVLAIKMTVYRTSDDSSFMPLLIRAAEAGKQVACLVELKARFDEDRNIRWANALVDAGVHVVYGVIGYKTHTKTALVVRQEDDGLRCYAHIGTGNYHPVTAKLYTDLGFFTCRPDLAGDVAQLFHSLTGRSLQGHYAKLLVAPFNMKRRFLDLIEREIQTHRSGRPAHIVAKMNQLEDRDIIRALYGASQAGVPVDLVIRGFCCLRPGIPGMSSTISVISIVGRFLEHSRIFHFRNGAEDPEDGEFFIGSADWMRRNLEERVEAITPIEDRRLRRKLHGILQVMLQDHRQAWDMLPDGTYRQRSPAPGQPVDTAKGTHEVLMERAMRTNRTILALPTFEDPVQIELRH